MSQHGSSVQRYDLQLPLCGQVGFSDTGFRLTRGFMALSNARDIVGSTLGPCRPIPMPSRMLPIEPWFLGYGIQQQDRARPKVGS